jgi:hypothetical protein
MTKRDQYSSEIIGTNNEPASVQHNHLHLQVNAALIEQLRAGYAQQGAREKSDLPLAEGPCRW